MANLSNPTSLEKFSQDDPPSRIPWCRAIPPIVPPYCPVAPSRSRDTEKAITTIQKRTATMHTRSKALLLLALTCLALLAAESSDAAAAPGSPVVSVREGRTAGMWVAGETW